VGLPTAKWLSHEAGVVVTGIVRDLLANPLGQADGLILTLQLDLGDPQPVVLTMEDIDLPFHAIVEDDVTRLVDERPHAQLQHPLGIATRDGVLQLDAGNALSRPFDGECGIIAGEANADAFVRIRAKIPLRKTAARPGGVITPSVTAEEEFAFNFEGLCVGWFHGMDKKTALSHSVRRGFVKICRSAVVGEAKDRVFMALFLIKINAPLSANLAVFGKLNISFIYA
jgi:hypothetical protein